MRNIIDKDIILKEPGHKYILKTDPSIDFQSVTEIIGNYFKPFDKQAIAEKLVATNIKYADTTVEALIANGMLQEIMGQRYIMKLNYILMTPLSQMKQRRVMRLNGYKNTR